MPNTPSSCARARWIYIIGLLLTLIEPPCEALVNNLAPQALISALSGLSIVWLVVLAASATSAHLIARASRHDDREEP